MDTRVVLHLGYIRPVGMTFVHLYTGTGMNGESLYAYIL